jgi:hypothetical protein
MNERSPRHREADEPRETGLDKTSADSFPASDPPSSIPDPDEEMEAASGEEEDMDEEEE